MAGWLPIIVWVTTTTLGVVVFAWMLRRPQREEGSPLAAALAMGAGAHLGIAPVLVGAAPRDGSPPSANPASHAAATEPTARSGLDSGPLTANRPASWQTRPPLRFEAAPGRDAVRRRITYRLVRLSDGPDDLRSREILRLDRGDEIEILGQEGSFLQVRTPTGEIGWIPSVSIIG